MSLFNYNAKEIHCKVIYYGIPAAGKTSNIKWISRQTISPEKLDLLSLPLSTKPSVFFDFLPLDIGVIRGFKTRFHLYSIPGSPLFDTSASLLLKGVDGFVFVVDSQISQKEKNLACLEKLQQHLQSDGLNLEKIPMVIQYNKRDEASIYSITELRALFNHHNHPDFPAVASKGEGVFETLKTIQKLVITVLKGGKPF